MSSHKRKADAAPAAASNGAAAAAAPSVTPAAKRPMFAAAAASAAAAAPSASGSDGVRVKQEDAGSSSDAAIKSEPAAALKFEDDDDGAEEAEYTPQSHLSGLTRDAAGNILCPYLATINRRALDFDFEKLCSVTLSNSNVYACLVCGKYFAGRGKSSPAYAHSLDPDLEHHVFINLHSEEIYCLPDGYRVFDPSLSDIQYNLHPRFTARELAQLDRNTQFVHALDGVDYLPGLMGLNNLGEGQGQTSVAVKHSITNRTDWINALIQFLNFIPMFRNAFIVEKKEQQQQQTTSGAAPAARKKAIKGETKGAAAAASSSSAASAAVTPAAASSSRPAALSTDLADKYGELLSKIWNPRSFKGHVSPHELLQTIATLSGKRFAIGKIHDVLQVLSWFLNELHRELGGTRKPGSSIVHRAFQGEIKITTTLVGTDDGAAMGDDTPAASVTTVETKPFLYLSLALPAAPLFKDATDKAILPQIPLVELLRKFDGSTVEHSVDPMSKRDVRRTYRLTRLPPYLIVHYQRFHENNWFWEKNPTLVNFPLQGLEMKPYTDLQQPATPAAAAAADGSKLSEDAVRKMSVAELKQALRARGVRSDTAVEKSELVSLLLAAPSSAAAASASAAASSTSTRYNLLSNIVHDGLSGAAAKGREKELRGSYKCHTLHKATNTWYLTEDLHVHTSETMPQLVSLSESYMQVYERQPE